MQQNIEKIFFFILRSLQSSWLCSTLALTEGEYFPSSVNMLTNSLKFSDTFKTNFSELISATPPFAVYDFRNE